MGKRSTLSRRQGAARLLLLAVLAVIAVLLCGRWTHRNQQKILTNEARLAYMAQLGWTAEETPIAEQVIQLPEVFPPVLEQYNSLQLQQGFDLTAYSGKEVEMYTYLILNHPTPPENGNVYGCLYIYRGNVIGGDIHSSSITGFMTGLRR